MKTPKFDSPKTQQPKNLTNPKLDDHKTWQPQNSTTPKLDDPKTSNKDQQSQVDRETDRGRQRYRQRESKTERDKDILTIREQTQKDYVPFRISTVTKDVEISDSYQRHRSFVLHQSEGWESDYDFVKVQK